MFVDAGAFRGDMCRIAALYQHGGYYVDVDIVYRDEAINLEEVLDKDVGEQNAIQFYFTLTFPSFRCHCFIENLKFCLI